jgi:hypothetical protein
MAVSSGQQCMEIQRDLDQFWPNEWSGAITRESRAELDRQVSALRQLFRGPSACGGTRTREPAARFHEAVRIGVERTVARAIEMDS